MSQQNRVKIIGLITIVLLSTAATTGVVVIKNVHDASQQAYAPNVINTNPTVPSQSTNGQTPSTPAIDSSQSSSASPAPAFTYKDGNYSATGQFYTPDGTEQIGVTLTLSGDKITSVSIDDSAIYSGTSFEYTQRFIRGINSVVVGKNIDSVSVGRISGASLTPIGFNNALDTIKSEAKA